MNPRITVGKGVTGAVRYVMGPGRDPATGQFKAAVAGENRVAWISGQGFGFEIKTEAHADLARRMMEFAALNQASRTRRCEKDCVHLSLSWRPGEKPTQQQMEDAARKALDALGMKNARAIFVAHNDEDYAHVHIVASKINPETGRAYDLKSNYLKLSAWAEGYERENGGIISTRRVIANELRDAIANQNAGAVLEALTKQRATFTSRQVETALAKQIRDPAERAGFTSQIFAHGATVALADRAGGETTRYTTRAVLEAEQYVLRAAQGLTLNNRHRLDDRQRAAVLKGKRFEGITAEQAHAFRHATGAPGLAVIDGQAGTGKSFTIAAVREAYEAAGYRVVGLGPTNAVAQDMRGDGFKHAATIHSELFALNNGRRSWNGKTVVIVDEAAMLDTRLMAMVTAHAHDAGAKLILVGDDRQLSSIDRGGMFGALKDRHGAAALSQVKRQHKVDERRAAEMMAEGNFHDALGIYQQKGAIHWTRTQGEARAALVHRWAQDSVLSPDKTRFVFAYTNDDVAAINAALRGVRQARSELGEDHQLDTAHGRLAFAVGDRIQFTGNDKRAGIVNGAAGRIEKIDGTAITVLIDGRKAPLITFDASAFGQFRHGYAGTVYKGQGKTLDQTFLYHSEHWRSAPSYVALTRHREKAELFVARNTAKDVKELARQMARTDERRAASMFHHGLDIAPIRPLTAKEILARFGGPEFRPRDQAQRATAAPATEMQQQPAARATPTAQQRQEPAARRERQRPAAKPAQAPPTGGAGAAPAKRRWWHWFWPREQVAQPEIRQQQAPARADRPRQSAPAFRPDEQAASQQQTTARQQAAQRTDWLAAELERQQRARDAPNDDDESRQQHRQRRSRSI
jgi:hypothetical protein